MPTILLLEGYRFFFYSNENNEPAHIHVKKSGAEGKIWLEPHLEIAWFNGFSTNDEKRIWQISTEYADQFKQKWNEYFRKYL
jgi:hypothetical protein